MKWRFSYVQRRWGCCLLWFGDSLKILGNNNMLNVRTCVCMWDVRLCGTFYYRSMIFFIAWHLLVRDTILSCVSGLMDVVVSCPASATTRGKGVGFGPRKWHHDSRVIRYVKIFGWFRTCVRFCVATTVIGVRVVDIGLHVFLWLGCLLSSLTVRPRRLL